MTEENRKRGRPRKRENLPERSAAQRTKEGEERYMVILRTESIEQMKDIAYWERLAIKDAFEEAFADRVAKYIKKNGPLKSRPKD